MHVIIYIYQRAHFNFHNCVDYIYSISISSQFITNCYCFNDNMFCAKILCLTEFSNIYFSYMNFASEEFFFLRQIFKKFGKFK